MRQPFTDGTGNSLQTPKRWDTLSDADRDSCYNGRLLFRNGAKTTDSIRRRPGSPWKDPSSQGRRATIIIAEERIQGLGVVLRQLLGQEEKPAIRADHRESEKVIVGMRTRQSRRHNNTLSILPGTKTRRPDSRTRTRKYTIINLTNLPKSTLQVLSVER